MLGFAEKSFVYGQKLGAFPDVTCNNRDYYLEGWYTLDGSTKVTSETIVTENVAYYARYVLKPVMVMLVVGQNYTVKNIDESWNMWKDNTETTYCCKYFLPDEAIMLPDYYHEEYELDSPTWRDGSDNYYQGIYTGPKKAEIILYPV